MEVLTLQLGNFANYTGAHFWNFQDELAGSAAAQDGHEGEGDDVPIDFSKVLEETQHGWRPRLVVVDKKGALLAYSASGGARAEPGLEDGALNAFWEGQVIDCVSDPFHSHLFQADLEREEALAQEQAYENGGGWGDEDEDEEDPSQSAHNDRACSSSVVRSTAEYNFRATVRSWTDFLKMRVPASSIRELQACQHGISPFALFFDGLDVRGREDEEEVLDAVRRQFELCDRMDALHTLYDMHDGFGGVTDIVMRWVAEEQPKSGKLFCALMPELEMPDGPQNGDDVLQELHGSAVVASQDVEACAWISAAFSFARLLDTCRIDAWLPVAVPVWSASPPAYLADFSRTSSYESSAFIASALETASLPYRLQGGLRPSQFISSLAPSGRPLCGLQQALPYTSGAGHPAAFFDLCGTPVLPGNPYSSIVLRGASPRELLACCNRLAPRSQRLCFAHSPALPLPVPFPQVFDRRVSSTGLVHGAAPRAAGDEVMACPVATHLHSAAHAGLCTPLKRMQGMLKAKRHSLWASIVRDKYGVEADEFRDVMEVVTEHLECGAGEGDEEESCEDSS